MDLATVLDGLIDAYAPRLDIDESTTAMYVRALGDLAPEEVERAGAIHLATSPYFPTVSDLRAIVFERRLALPSDVDAARQLATGSRQADFHPAVWDARCRVGDSWDWRISQDVARMQERALRIYRQLRGETIAAANVRSLEAGPLRETPSLTPAGSGAGAE